MTYGQGWIQVLSHLYYGIIQSIVLTGSVCTVTSFALSLTYFLWQSLHARYSLRNSLNITYISTLPALLILDLYVLTFAGSFVEFIFDLFDMRIGGCLFAFQCRVLFLVCFGPRPFRRENHFTFSLRRFSNWTNGCK
jgi:hypothetical protein